MRRQEGAYSAILWPDNGMLFPLFSRDYCGNQLLICGVTQPVLNNLSLANDSIRFHSSVTAHGMLWRLLVVFVISGVTLGLAYPWLKIWLVSWLAQNTQVRGDLDSLELTTMRSRWKTAC